VRSRGNPQRGRALYLDGKKPACVNCHRLEGVGGHVGPDLTRQWETQSIEKIMESIIERFRRRAAVRRTAPGSSRCRFAEAPLDGLTGCRRGRARASGGTAGR
jgi:hypothetical protein